MPVSEPKALAIGVSSAARAFHSSAPVAPAMSMAWAQLSPIPRAANVSTRMVISIRRTSA